MFGRLSLVFPRRTAAFWTGKTLIGIGQSRNRFFQMGSQAKNQNKELCDMLKQLSEYESKVTKNTYKSRAYNQAAVVLARHEKKVSSGAEAKKLKGIGDKIGKKIDEYLATGTMTKLEKIHNDDSAEAIMLLSKVHGIGAAKAHELVEKHEITSLEQLREKQDELLNHHQLIGMKYFDDFEKKIPRAEVEAVEQVVKTHMATFDPELEVTFCGSFRRGKQESGDMDILVSKPSYISTCNKKEGSQVLRTFIQQLEAIGLVTDTISLGDSKFMGVCNLHKVKGHKKSKSTFRHLDVRVCPHDQYYCMILHFTGSSHFNQNMRLHAQNQGFTLNEYTLRPIGSTGTPGAPVSISSEKEIFEYIDYPYKNPENRDV